MYFIDPDSVERRIKELHQIEIITRAPGVSRQDATRRDTSRHDATVRDTSRQEVSSEKIEGYERRIKELENEKMQIEIDKRAKEFVINQLMEDRKNLFGQVSEHVRTITDQARVIGQLETRLELGPGRVVHEESFQPRYDRPPVDPVAEPARQSVPPVEEYRRAPEPPRRERPTVEYPPRYSSYPPQEQGDNRSAGHPGAGVQ
ncbi:MAG: hypothetical protein U1E42_00005 [Rhodospirillales bacterium]